MDNAVATYAFAAVVAGLAAAIDLLRRRIPNWLTLGGLLGGLALHVVQDGPLGLLTALLGVAIGLGILLPFYAMRAMGAGDVKLLACLGAVVGPPMVIWVAIYAAIAGGLVSAVMLARARRLRETLTNIAFSPTRLQRSGLKAPYAVPIAAGVYLSMFVPAIIH